jgi:hypothetical protein
MKARGGFVPAFHFTKEQREGLMIALPRGRDKATRMLDRIEFPISEYLSISKEFRKDPPSPRGIQLREISNLSRLLGRTRDALNSIDAATWQSYFVWGLADIGVRTPYEMVERTTSDMERMQIALRFTREKLPKPQVGKPSKDLEIGLIAETAIAFEHIYGKLPPKRPESKFNDFVTQMFACFGSDQIDFSRLVEQAICRIVAQRKT